MIAGGSNERERAGPAVAPPVQGSSIAATAAGSPGADASAPPASSASSNPDGATIPESVSSPSPSPSPSGDQPEPEAPKVHATTSPPPSPAPSLWPARMWTVAATFYEWLVRPRVRLTVTGAILLAIGGLLVKSSVWTLPLVIVGALMIVIAWIGYRLDGRLAVEWGEAGTQLEFRAQIKGSQTARPTQPRAALTSRYLARSAEPEPQDAEVVEGEAHTVEIEVADLTALIAAAETEEADIAQTEPSAQAKRNLRVAESAKRSSDGRQR